MAWVAAHRLTLHRLRKAYEENDDKVKAALKIIATENSIWPTEEVDKRVDEFYASVLLKYEHSSEADVLASLKKATFLGAQASMVYLSVARKMLSKLEELGGIEKYLSKVGIDEEKRCAIRKILIVSHP